MENPTQEERNNFGKRLRYTNITYQVMNTSEKIKSLNEFSVFCKEYYLFRLSVFKWASKTHSSHRGMGHIITAIKRNDGYGLGQISETCLESSNKTLRHSSENLARQHDVYVNMVDYANFMWYASDPVLQKKYTQKKEKNKFEDFEALDEESKTIYRFIYGDD